MENKIVYLKTYIITIVAMFIILIATVAGLVYYYENRIKSIENAYVQKPDISGITILNENDTSLENVKAE